MWYVRTRYNIVTDGYDMLIVRKNMDGSQDIVDPLKFTRYSTGTFIDKVTLESSSMIDAKDILLACVNEASNLRIYPAKFGGEIDAIKYHLEDMRKLVFK